MSRIALVLLLKPGARERAAELLRQGPGFEPESAGLERYEIFLSDDELVLALDGELRTADGIVEEAAALLRAPVWQELAAGPARVAEEVYSWVRPLLTEDVLFEPTPGPGDSEGGDIFPPRRR